MENNYVLNVKYHNGTIFSEKFESYEKAIFMMDFYDLPNEDVEWFDINEAEVQNGRSN